MIANRTRLNHSTRTPTSSKTAWIQISFSSLNECLNVANVVICRYLPINEIMAGKHRVLDIKTSFKQHSLRTITLSLCLTLCLCSKNIYLYIFKAVNSAHFFWMWSSSLFGCFLCNVASGWVFTHRPVSFQGAAQAEDVAKSHSGPDLSENTAVEAGLW